MRLLFIPNREWVNGLHKNASYLLRKSNALRNDLPGFTAEMLKYYPDTKKFGGSDHCRTLIEGVWKTLTETMFQYAGAKK